MNLQCRISGLNVWFMFLLIAGCTSDKEPEPFKSCIDMTSMTDGESFPWSDFSMGAGAGTAGSFGGITWPYGWPHIKMVLYFSEEMTFTLEARFPTDYSNKI